MKRRNDEWLSRWFKDKYGVSLIEARITGVSSISLEDLIEATTKARQDEYSHCQKYVPQDHTAKFPAKF